jgi:hypothetical protein
VDRTHDKEILIGELALQVGDCLPGGPSSDSEYPGVAYGPICLAGLLGLAFCAAVVIGTLILTEGEAGGDDEDDGNGGGDDVGDFPIPDPEGPTHV